MLCNRKLVLLLIFIVPIMVSHLWRKLGCIDALACSNDSLNTNDLLAKSAWNRDEDVTLWVYVSKAPIQLTFEEPESKLLFKHQFNLGKSLNLEKAFTISLDGISENYPNENLFLHVFVCKMGEWPDKLPYSPESCVYRRFSLINTKPDLKDGQSFVPYWHPFFSLNFVNTEGKSILINKLNDVSLKCINLFF